MYIFNNSLQNIRKYSLQIVTIGSGVLLKTIYLDRKKRKFFQDLAKNLKLKMYYVKNLVLQKK
jgi:RNAse (barnase) inhibitor barstar